MNLIDRTATDVMTSAQTEQKFLQKGSRVRIILKEALKYTVCTFSAKSI